MSVPPETTLIILRHADRVGEDLTEQGIARAEALVAALEGVPIDAIYAPGIKRNLETAVPLARARGLTVQRIPAENPAAQLMASGAGKTIVWIGNKGNLQSIWDAISAPEPPPLNYGDLFFVTRARVGSPLVERRRVEP
ncbi:hypothetical protein AIOL_004285 [Candidatus Rhodobacter oscarellae]|uniref:Histidine phosphatase family protein n=1 Tax=Candidatus Rhodobacter oscarellae TaxID=1675527 RepID=A0A0J9H0P0_9RHOB|nr:hypothetical protein AIOL_004285 [Candidatus Rhodobacter lobularis]